MATYKAKSLVMPNGDEFVPDENVFVAEYGVTTWAEVNAAYEAGKALLCIRGTKVYLCQEMDGDYYYFVHPTRNEIHWVDVFSASGTTWEYGSQKSVAYPEQSVAISPSSNQYISVSTTSGMLNRSTINFGSSTTKYLSQKGTWENVPTVPSNVSSFNNDAGYITLADLPIWDGSVT